MADIIGATGFNYTKNWGSQLGQTGQFNLGSRPPAKTDWDAMSQEERNAVGVPDWNAWQAAQNAWQKRNQEGGDIHAENVRAAEAIQRSGAKSWPEVEQALINAGFDPSIGANAPLFKQLAMAFQGSADPSARYHWNGSSWVDMGTSDLAKRGVAGMADYNGPHLSGMDAIKAALPGFREFELFKQWNRGGSPTQPGRPGEGLTPIGNGFYRAIHGQIVDDLGFVYDPNTMQRTGHYIPGSGADKSVAGGGGATGGIPPGGGGGPSLSSMAGGGGGNQYGGDLRNLLAAGGGGFFDGLTGGGGGGGLGSMFGGGGQDAAFASQADINSELAKQTRLDTLNQMFNYERAANEYGQAIPLENYMKDLYGDILGVDFENPQLSLSDYFNQGLEGVGGMHAYDMGGGVGQLPPGTKKPNYIPGYGAPAGNYPTGPVLQPGGDPTGGGGQEGGLPPNGPPENPDYSEVPYAGAPSPSGGMSSYNAALPADAEGQLPGMGGGKGFLNDYRGMSGGQTPYSPGDVGLQGAPMLGDQGPGVPVQPGSGTRYNLSPDQTMLPMDPNQPPELGPAQPQAPGESSYMGTGYGAGPNGSMTGGFYGGQINPGLKQPLIQNAGTGNNWLGANQVGTTGGGASLSAPTIPQLNGPGYKTSANAYDPSNPKTWAFLAAPANQIGSDLNSAIARLKAETQPGGERDAGIASLIKGSYGDVAGLRQGLVSQALSGISGLAGAKKGFNPGGYSGSGQAVLGADTSRYATDANRYSTDKNYDLGLQGLKVQKDAARSSFWGGLLNTIGGVAGSFIGTRK